jgi:putative PIN family toxin of toxin-antitoxin system
MRVFQRVVFDTSTLVSAALRVGSLSHQALALALSTGEIFVSQSTFAELEAVLMRPKFDRYQSAPMRAAFVAFVRKHAVLVSVSEVDESGAVPVCRDPKDNQFLALIRACDAEVLVSSDADLLTLHPWQGVPILAPAAFLLSNE